MSRRFWRHGLTLAGAVFGLALASLALDILS